MLLDSQKLPGKVTAGGAAGVNPKDYDLVALAMQEPQYRSPGVRELLDSVATSKVPCMSIMNMPPLPYIKRIPGLDYEALKPAYTDPSRLGQFRSRPADAVQPRPAGDPSARRARPTSCWSRCRPTSRSPSSTTTSTPQILRDLEKDIEAVRFDAPEGKIELPVKLRVLRFDLRAAGQVVDAARRQLPLHHQRRHAHRAGSGAQQHRRVASVYNFVFDLCVKLGASPSDLVPFEKYAAAAQSLSRPASAARALQNGAPNIERADKLVQLIAKQKGMSHPAIDAQVALVDARIEANRKKAAA